MRRVAALLLAIVPASVSASTSEAQAIDLVFKAVHQLYPRESLRCFSLMIEERSRGAFEIAVRENHKRGCGGDPGVMPVRDRFRVSRTTLGLWRYDVPADAYRRCRLTRGGRPLCPRLSYE